MKLRLLLTVLIAAPMLATAQSSTHCQGPSLTAENMVEVRESISKSQVDETRLQVAKNITSQNCFTAEQVAIVTRIFSSEKTKVEYAKFAYAHTIDKEYYSKVFTAFNSESSKSDLLSFMKARR